MKPLLKNITVETSDKPIIEYFKEALSKIKGTAHLVLTKPDLTEPDVVALIDECKHHPDAAVIDITNLKLNSTGLIKKTLAVDDSNVVVCESKLSETSNSLILKGRWKSNVVAVKFMPNDPNKMILAENEIHIMQTLSKTDNDYVVRYFHHFHLKSKTVIVMEFAPIGSLESIIDKQSEILWSPETRFNLMKQMAQGLAYVHEAGFFHLDIKPANFLIYNGYKIKLTDFGFSLPAPEGFIQLHSTRGTPGFMAPEMISQDILSEKTDVFSLSVTFAIMLHWCNDIFDELAQSDPDFDDDLLLDAIHTNTLNGQRPDLPPANLWPEFITAEIKQGWDHYPDKRPKAAEIVEAFNRPFSP